MSAAPKPDVNDSEHVTMTLGEHLEELRWRLVKCLIGLVVGCLVCIWPAKFLLEIVARPVVLALRRYGQPDNFLSTSPVEVLLVYIKVVVLSGLVLASPYVLYQLWSFVAAGLYRPEKQWVYRLVPWSVGLFVLGVLFMYTFVLAVSLNFLVGFNTWVPLPQPTPNFYEQQVLGHPTFHVPASQPGVAFAPSVPLLADDPPSPPVGRMWFNLNDSRLKLRGTDETFSLQFSRDESRSLVTSHFKIGEYLSFVLVMTIAFGAAFQMPLVVLFLARTGIVPEKTLREYRKVVILIIIFIAGILAPPDLFSHLLLSGPMILLFELGLVLARRGSRAAEAS